MTGEAATVEHSASLVGARVAKKTAILACIGIVAAVAVQMTAWPGYPLWPVPVGVAVGAAIGAVNFR